MWLINLLLFARILGTLVNLWLSALILGKLVNFSLFAQILGKLGNVSDKLVAVWTYIQNFLKIRTVSCRHSEKNQKHTKV